MFVEPGPPIRAVESVVSYPQMLSDGRVLCVTGYCAVSKLLVTADTDVQIPDRPSAGDANRACRTLLDVFREFEFADDGGRSKSAVLALILTMFARPMVGGPVPFFMIQKNAPGTGGTLVMKAVWRIVTGGDMPTVSYTHDEPESRKLLTSLVQEGRSAIPWDNIDGDFGTASFCRFVTTPSWEDRILGGSKMMKAAVRAVMFGSANNAVLLREMPRRTVTIDLFTEQEHPEQVKKDRPDLLGFIDEHREELLTAAFTILRAWVVAGRPQPVRAKADDPDPMPQFGSFESWSRVVRAALIFAGQPDPFTPAAARDDHRRQLLRTVATGIRELDRDGQGLTAAQIIRDSNTAEYQSAAVLEMADAIVELVERPTAVSLGKVLASAKRWNLGGIRIVDAAQRDTRRNMPKWRVEEVVAKPKADQETAPESPEYPASDFTNKLSSAGDSGDSNGTSRSGLGFECGQAVTTGKPSRPRKADPATAGDPVRDEVAFESLVRRSGWGEPEYIGFLEQFDEYIPERKLANLNRPQKEKLVARLNEVVSAKGGAR